jgi:hypothetical protein
MLHRTCAEDPTAPARSHSVIAAAASLPHSVIQSDRIHLPGPGGSEPASGLDVYGAEPNPRNSHQPARVALSQRVQVLRRPCLRHPITQPGRQPLFRDEKLPQVPRAFPVVVGPAPNDRQSLGGFSALRPHPRQGNISIILVVVGAIAGSELDPTSRQATKCRRATPGSASPLDRLVTALSFGRRGSYIYMWSNLYV